MTDNFYAPPHSIEAEQAVIGGLLLDDDSSERVRKVLAMLKPDSFYSRPHKIIFEEITRMHREQKPVDGLTLFDELERKSLTASVGGFAYIAEIAKNTPSAANIVAYAMQVRETAMERYAINRMTEATELLYSRNGMTATQKYEAIQSIFTQLTDHAKTGSRRGLRSFGEVMEDWVSDLEKRFDPSGEQRGMSTGIPSLDRMLSPKGLVKGSLFVIGARPKMGKTTLYSQMAINCAVHEKKPALMFSLEMPGDQILEKLVGQKSGVNPNIFYLPATNDADDGYQGDYDGDFNRAIETANRLSEIDLLYIDDTPGLSLAQIVSESRRIKREKGCVGMILVDYLTLMTAEKADRNDLAYGMITKGLKNLAKELDCVVVLLTQLNRALESRTNKRPLPSDSRDTGQIEQDCDYWVGIHREKAQQLISEAPKLSVNMEKAIETAVNNATASSNSANSMSALAQQFRAEKPTTGLFGNAQNMFAKLTGSDTTLRDLRIRQNALVNSQVLKFLPPGPATDKDVEIVRQGAPTDMDNPETVARWLDAMANLERRNAQFNEFKAEWMSANGNPGQSRNGGQILGLDVKKGESLGSAVKRYMSMNTDAAPEQDSTPSGEPRNQVGSYTSKSGIQFTVE